MLTLGTCASGPSEFERSEIGGERRSRSASIPMTNLVRICWAGGPVNLADAEWRMDMRGLR